MRRTLTWTFPLKRRLIDLLFFRPVRFAFVSGRFLHLLELLQQQTLVVELMDMGRSEIHQRLMGPAVVVALDVTAQFFSCRYLIGIVSHQIDLFLLDRSIKPLGQRIVRRASYTGKGQLGFQALEEFLGDPGGVGRSPIHPELGLFLTVNRYPLVLNPTFSTRIEISFFSGAKCEKVS